MLGLKMLEIERKHLLLLLLDFEACFTIPGNGFPGVSSGDKTLRSDLALYIYHFNCIVTSLLYSISELSQSVCLYFMFLSFSSSGREQRLARKYPSFLHLFHVSQFQSFTTYPVHHFAVNFIILQASRIVHYQANKFSNILSSSHPYLGAYWRRISCPSSGG